MVPSPRPADYGIRPRRILEVSSYDGSTLDRLRTAFDAEAFGIEPTVEAVDFADRAFPKLSGRMLRSQLEDAGDFIAANGPFDAVTISIASRQMSRPLRAIELLQACVPTGGIVMVDEGGLLDDALTIESIPALSWGVHCAQKNFLYARISLIALVRKGRILVSA